MKFRTMFVLALSLAVPSALWAEPHPSDPDGELMALQSTQLPQAGLPDSLNESQAVESLPFDSVNTNIRIGGLNIRIAEDGQVSTFSVDNETKSERKAVITEWAMLDLGINVLTRQGDFQIGNDGAPFNDLRYGRSMNLDMHVFRQRASLVKNVFNLEYGLTFSWYNFAFQDDIVLTPRADEFTFGLSDDPLRKSKLSATYLTIPLMLNLETNPDRRSQSFRLSAGVTGGIRIASRTKIKTEEKAKTRQRDDFNLNAFRYGPIVRVGYGWFNLYAQYALSDFFTSGEGPQLNAFTAGISLRAF
jgi:hypothetical protein